MPCKNARLVNSPGPAGCPGGQNRLQGAFHRHQTAVNAQLHHILTCVGAGRTKHQRHRLIKGFFALCHAAETSRVAGQIGEPTAVRRTEYCLGDLYRPITGQPHHADPAHTVGVAMVMMVFAIPTPSLFGVMIK